MLPNKVLRQCGSKLAAHTVRSGSVRRTPTLEASADKILTFKSRSKASAARHVLLPTSRSMELLAEGPGRGAQDPRPVLERMMEAVHHYEGTVIKVMGDGIMALFGAPWLMRSRGARLLAACESETVKQYAQGCAALRPFRSRSASV